jgi:glycosyltransferase involved in cell wall biosynthesis
MRCPSLCELPPPPAGMTGWPWTEESPRLPGDPAWPRVSIITPSYNQGQFLEETIRSVLLQGYPDLEYIVIDGGSTDGSVDVLRRYARWLTDWVSEPDRGQTHALNKGLARATGEICNWINSDDSFLPGALAQVASVYRANPGCVVAASVQNVYEMGGLPPRLETCVQTNLCLEALVRYWEGRFVFHQPGVFFPRDAWLDVGGLDESLTYVMDYDFLCRILTRVNVCYLDSAVARFRFHPGTKTVSHHLEMFVERMKVSQRYWTRVSGVDTAAFRSYAIAHLVRYAGTEALAGHRDRALAYLKAALDISPTVALRELLRQLDAGIRRRFLVARTRQPASTNPNRRGT